MSAFEPFPAPPPGRVVSGRQSRLSLPSGAIDAAIVDDLEPPTEMDVKISLLSAKIDKLTDIILALQKDKDEASTSSSPERQQE